MASGRLRRNCDEVLKMDVACTVDVTESTGIPYSARKRLQYAFEEREVEERVKRPLNAFMVWSQVIMCNCTFIFSYCVSVFELHSIKPDKKLQWAFIA